MKVAEQGCRQVCSVVFDSDNFGMNPALRIAGMLTGNINHHGQQNKTVNDDNVDHQHHLLRS